MADRSELHPDLVGAAERVVVDDVATALDHAGSILQAIAAGSIAPEALRSIGRIMLDSPNGAPASAGAITVYNSVGFGLQDAAAAAALIPRVRARGAGAPLFGG